VDDRRGRLRLGRTVRACIDHTLSPSRGGSGRHFAVLDLGLTHDRTVLAIVHWDEDNVVLDELQAWQGSKSEPVSIAAVEQALVDAADRYTRLEVYADPWQLKRSLERLGGRVRIEEWVFSQSSVRKLSATLLNAITTKTLRVYPDHELEREVTGPRVVETPSGWRFDHRTGGYSDRAVALAMAILLAQDRRPKGFVKTAATVVPTGEIPLLSVRSGIAGEQQSRVKRSAARPVQAGGDLGGTDVRGARRPGQALGPGRAAAHRRHPRRGEGCAREGRSSEQPGSVTLVWASVPERPLSRR
jgi:hypothetical protein